MVPMGFDTKNDYADEGQQQRRRGDERTNGGSDGTRQHIRSWVLAL
jgi:hypothetical protein